MSPLGRLAAISVDQYHAMIKAGILPEGAPIELLDGLLVWKDRSDHGGGFMTIGPNHAICLMKIEDLQPDIRRLGAHLRSQKPIQIPPSHEPEPDAMIVCGKPYDIIGRHPNPNEVSCVIEVSSSSLEHDRTGKLRVYAAAGIPQYIVVNLIDRRVEVFEGPSFEKSKYTTHKIIKPGKSVSFLAGKKRLSVPVSNLLP